MPSRYTEYESNALLFNDGKNAVGGKQREQFRSFAKRAGGNERIAALKDERINLSNTTLFLYQCHGESFTPDRLTTKAHQREKEI